MLASTHVLAPQPIGSKNRGFPRHVDEAAIFISVEEASSKNFQEAFFKDRWGDMGSGWERHCSEGSEEGK